MPEGFEKYQSSNHMFLSNSFFPSPHLRFHSWSSSLFPTVPVSNHQFMSFPPSSFPFPVVLAPSPTVLHNSCTFLSHIFCPFPHLLSLLHAQFNSLSHSYCLTVYVTFSQFLPLIQNTVPVPSPQIQPRHLHSCPFRSACSATTVPMPFAQCLFLPHNSCPFPLVPVPFAQFIFLLHISCFFLVNLVFGNN